MKKLPLFVYGILRTNFVGDHFFPAEVIEKAVPAVAVDIEANLGGSIAFARRKPGGFLLGEVMPIHILPDSDYHDIMMRVDALESAYNREEIKAYIYKEIPGRDVKSWIQIPAHAYIVRYNQSGPVIRDYAGLAVDNDNLLRALFEGGDMEVLGDL